MGKKFMGAALVAVITLIAGAPDDLSVPPANAAPLAQVRNDVGQTDTLLGVDANSNGVRDDIDAYIEKSVHHAMRLAATQSARGFQRVMATDIKDRNALRETANQFTRDNACVWETAQELRKQGTGSAAAPITRALEALTANTAKRQSHYAAFNSGASGMVFTNARTGNCDK